MDRKFRRNEIKEMIKSSEKQQKMIVTVLLSISTLFILGMTFFYFLYS